MRFSIIIPVYNSENFLHKCLDSIVLQNYSDYELILVDDGSTDNSQNICRAYAEKYGNIRLVFQENAGPSAARNHGISLAAGEYIAFVDSDDWVQPNYFETLLLATEQSPDLVFFGTTHWDGVCATPKTFPTEFLPDNSSMIAFLVDHYQQGDICSAVNKLYAKWLFLGGSLRFPTGTVVEEDLQFVLLAIDKANSLLSIEDALYCYNRRESGSVTTKYNPHKFDCKTRAYKAELQMAEKWGQKKLAAFFHDNYLSYISSCINNLMYCACPLSRKKKLQEIRRFFLAEETVACIASTRGLCLRSKVVYMLISLRLYRVSYWLHFITFRLRRR